MRIAYINHGRFPTEKAHGFQIAQVCDALTTLGHAVTVFCPTVRNSIALSPAEYYGLCHTLAIQRVAHFDAFLAWWIPGFLGFAVTMRAYGNALRKLLTHERFDLLYVRSPLLIASLLSTQIPVILELHALPRFGRTRFVRLCNQCERVVCLTTPMLRELQSWGVTTDRLTMEPDGVDLCRFASLPDVATAKQQWLLPADRPVIGYVGSLATRERLEKGVRELIEAPSIRSALRAELLGMTSPLLWVVGGPQTWVDVYKKYALSLGLRAWDIRFEGHIGAGAVPSAIAACDVCVYPAPKSSHPYFLRDTSPLKLFEYLAGGRPVVCADLPTVRDVVDERSVKFFRPGDAADLAAAISDVLDHPKEAAARAAEGKRIVQEHSWEKRMGRILLSCKACQ